MHTGGSRSLHTPTIHIRITRSNTYPYLTLSTPITYLPGLPRRDRFLFVGMSANSDEQTKLEVTHPHTLSRSTITIEHTTLHTLQHILSYLNSSLNHLIIYPLIQTMVAGMDHFMSKPFDYVDLEAILDDHDRNMLAADAV